VEDSDGHFQAEDTHGCYVVMTYVLTYRTTDESAYGEFLVGSWKDKPTRDQLAKCGISNIFNTYLQKNCGKLYLQGRIYELKEIK
jgi:hypothetical protein